MELLLQSRTKVHVVCNSLSLNNYIMYRIYGSSFHSVDPTISSMFVCVLCLLHAYIHDYACVCG